MKAILKFQSAIGFNQQNTVTKSKKDWKLWILAKISAFLWETR